MENRECEKIEMYRSQNEVRKFYQRVKHTTEGFDTGASSCKDKDGNLVTDEDSVLRRGKNIFTNCWYPVVTVMRIHLNQS